MKCKIMFATRISTQELYTPQKWFKLGVSGDELYNWFIQDWGIAETFDENTKQYGKISGDKKIWYVSLVDRHLRFYYQSLKPDYDKTWNTKIQDSWSPEQNPSRLFNYIKILSDDGIFTKNQTMHILKEINYALEHINNVYDVPDHALGLKN